ncbi:hypothetical protein SBRCBS47491_007441 [Sporothrix bragantina]|uniref:Calcineurin-like phosphoesterase domain-containing protein n=1 Tax=Sporothrix bragantina TaxID=671064 RepID=A0ABP0CD72_9PEZI
MAIQIVSDLHLEIHDDYDTYDIEPRAPVLALLGDIGLVATHRLALAGFLARHLRRFKVVLFVPGNHEAYHSTWPRTRQLLQSFEDEVCARRDEAEENGATGLGELVILDRQAYRLPGPVTAPPVIVVGCSLFSYAPPQHAAAIYQGMNDFRLTGGGWDVDAHNDAHARDRQWLNQVVTSMTLNGAPDLRIVVLTHWSPTTDPRARDARHGDAAQDPLSGAFATDMSGDACFQSSKVRAWAFGHTHYNCDFLVKRQTEDGRDLVPIRLYTNQRGYSGAGAPRYNPNKVLTLE